MSQSFDFEDYDEDFVYEDESAALSALNDSQGTVTGKASNCWNSTNHFYDGQLVPLINELYQYAGHAISSDFPQLTAKNPECEHYWTLCIGILAATNWILEDAVDACLADSSSAYQTAGFGSYVVVPEYRLTEPHLCPILNVYCESLVENPSCGHKASLHAWCGYITALDHVARSARCMFCRYPLSKGLIDTVLNTAQLNLWKNRIVEDIVGKCAWIKCCPTPDCPGIIVSEEYTPFSYRPDAGGVEEMDGPCALSPLPFTEGSPYLCNVCDQWMCLACGNEDHMLIPCEMFCDWLLKNSSESQNVLWLLVNTKNCPSCSKPIEKNQGCMHITCKCAHEFCWLCLDSWSKHRDTYRCNFYEENGGKTIFELTETDPDGLSSEVRARMRDKSKRYLDKYTFYFGRYASHQQGSDMTKLAKALLQYKQKQQSDGAAKAVDRSPPPLTFFSAMEKALQTINYGRRLLKFTYVYGFYANWADSPMKLLFEDQQGQMERALDLLQEAAEGFAKTVQQIDFQEFISVLSNLTKVVSDFFNRMRDAFSREIVLKHSRYCIIGVTKKRMRR